MWRPVTVWYTWCWSGAPVFWNHVSAVVGTITSPWNLRCERA